jgi:thiol-disulfide isomerase/thioredoxin
MRKASSLLSRLMLIIISLFVGLTIQAQDAKEVLTRAIQAIDNLQAVGYRTVIEQTNPMNGDTTRLESDCLMKRVPEDTIAGFYYYFSSGSSGFYKYNGTTCYSYSPDYYDYILRYTLEENPEKFRALKLSVGVVSSEVVSLTYFLYSIFKARKGLSEILQKWPSDILNREIVYVITEDTVVENAPCLGIKMEIKGSKYSYYKWAFINKHTFLPVVVITDTRGGEMVINNTSISMDQYTRISFLNITDQMPDLEYLLGDASLPRGVAVLDHRPQVVSFKVGDFAPAWRLPELYSAKLISSDSLAGKILILDFTSTWCIHCAEGSIVMKGLYHKYGKNERLRFINIFSSDIDTREKIEKYVDKHELEGLTLFNAAGSNKAYGVQGYPQFFIVGGDGRVVFFQRGYSINLDEAIGKELETLLK